MAKRLVLAFLGVRLGVVAGALSMAGCELALGLGDLKDMSSDATASESGSESSVDKSPDATSTFADGPNTTDAIAMDAQDGTSATSPDGRSASGGSSGGSSSSSSGSGSDSGGAIDGGRADADDASPVSPVEGGSDAFADVGPGHADAAPASPPSCVPGGLGMTNCGPGGSGTESCCTSLPVMGGTYDRTYGSDPDSGVATGLADPATVSAFRLDKYEITVGRFRQFVSAFTAGWVPPAASGKHTHLNGGMGLLDNAAGTYETGWNTLWNGNLPPAKVGWDNNLSCDSSFQTWSSMPGANENLPINCVDWYEAYAFCIWDGAFLPSEAEWGYAAGGGRQQRQYPWGGTWPGLGSIMEFQYAITYCEYPDFTRCTGTRNIGPVGYPYSGAGLWGQLDLGGNVYEWNFDWSNPYANPCTDCAVTTATDAGVVIRGGSFNGGDITAALRDAVSTPTWRYYSIGARCARAP